MKKNLLERNIMVKLNAGTTKAAFEKEMVQNVTVDTTVEGYAIKTLLKLIPQTPELARKNIVTANQILNVFRHPLCGINDKEDLTVKLETNVKEITKYGEISIDQAIWLSTLRNLGNQCEIEVYEHQSRPYHYCFRYPGEKDFFKKFLTYDEAREYLEGLIRLLNEQEAKEKERKNAAIYHKYLETKYGKCPFDEEVPF